MEREDEQAREVLATCARIMGADPRWARRMRGEAVAFDAIDDTSMVVLIEARLTHHPVLLPDAMHRALVALYATHDDQAGRWGDPNAWRDERTVAHLCQTLAQALAVYRERPIAARHEYDLPQALRHSPEVAQLVHDLTQLLLPYLPQPHALRPDARATLEAVVHELQHGEASDLLDHVPYRSDALAKLAWCRDELTQLLTLDARPGPGPVDLAGLHYYPKPHTEGDS